MAVYKRDIVDINLETGNIHRSWLKHSIGYKDQKADHFGVRTYRDGTPVDLTGVSVQGVFLPPQGDPIAITSGNIVSGNVAEVVLPQACYNYDGQFTLAIKLVDSNNNVTGTVRIVDGMVDNTHASGTVAPTSAVPTYQEILSTYDAMIAATAAANGAIAATYSSSSTYAVGDYCIHDGGLYRCTTAINSGEAWTAAHWTAAKIGPDLATEAATRAAADSDLKSAILSGGVKCVPFSSSNKFIDLSGDTVALSSDLPVLSNTSSYYYCYMIPCEKGDIFEITGVGGGNARNYAFIKSFTSGAASAEIITKSPANVTYDRELVVAPNLSAYIIVQDKGRTGSLYQCPKNVMDYIYSKMIDIDPTADYATSASAMQGHLTDLNDAKENRIYTFMPTANLAGQVSNLPSDMPLDGTIWQILTVGHTLNGSKGKIQFIYKNNLKYIYRRQYDNGQWYSWSRVLDISDIPNTIKIDPTINIHTNDYNYGNLTDLNTAVANTCYLITAGGSITTSVSNLPSDFPLNGKNWYALTLNFNSVGTAKSYIQYLFMFDLTTIYRRQYEAGTWYSWRKITNRRQITVDINGSGDYTSFTSALANAYSNGDTDIFVKNGVYDITSEITLSSAGSGPTIGKGVRIFCEPDVLIKCEYTGDSSTVKSTFAVLNAGTGDYEIHDMNLQCKNIRYCVHDELVQSATPYHHKYINCRMKLDNSESHWDSPQCIGGGLGKYGIIEVIGGYYEGLPHVGDNTYGEVSYHNTGASTGKSKITIRDVYFKNNTARFGYYGTSTDITECFVSGCSMKAEPIVRPETSGSTVVNMVMYDWNNEIRSDL